MLLDASFSSSSNLSLPPILHSSVNVSASSCFEFSVSSYIFTALVASYFVFFLPLCISVFHLALRRCLRQNEAASNTDVFTYNILVMELVGMTGGCFFSVGVYTESLQIKMVGICFYTIIMPGQMLFHSLTSVERYLAVIHPVLYLGLRKAQVVRIRNISIACIWVASCGWVMLTAMYGIYSLYIPITLLLVFSVIINSFCSLSILLALHRPSPGDDAGNRDRVDQMKKRALQTVMVITGLLLMNLGGGLLCVLVEATGALTTNSRCAALMIGLSSTVPSSYVMPLLFLHRAGKLTCFKMPQNQCKRQNKD